MKEKFYCPLCGGEKNEGYTTFTVELEDGIVIVRHVPAIVCGQCGMEWIDDKVAELLERVVNEVKHKGTIIEVREFSKIAS
ncbi:MAG: type II toxin-antitoxin system MqsA family antitoxin [Spirochaetota bacterium]